VATGKNLRTFENHIDLIFSVAFSPEGRTALSARKDKTFVLWELTTGKPLRTFTGHSDAVASVVFSPDGRSILVRQQRLYDPALRIPRDEAHFRASGIEPGECSSRAGPNPSQKERLMAQAKNCTITRRSIMVAWKGTRPKVP
jgi:hypothetical protein